MGERGRSGGGDKGRVQVRDRRGHLQPFLRGMVTHDLTQRGLSFDDAYATARAVRDRLKGREIVETSELEDLVDQQLEAMIDPSELIGVAPRGGVAPRSRLVVQTRNGPLPFSRGLLAQSIRASGVDLDRAYRLALEVERDYAVGDERLLSSEELAGRVGELLEEWEGDETASRYRMVRRIHRWQRPLILYLGGTTGSGKSTLALEIAPLLRIYRVNATDMIRQVMRSLFSPSILPALHRSSFEIDSTADLSNPNASAGPADPEELLASFDEQATRVCVGVRAVVERSLTENRSVIIEGVHLAPPHVPFGDLEGAVTQVPLVLTTEDEEVHRSRFLSRSTLSSREAERYLEHFGAIRALQTKVVDRARQQGIPIFDTSDGETAVARGLRLVTQVLEARLPEAGLPVLQGQEGRVPTLFLALDGLPDHPVRALGGRTPLAAANTPTLDRLAEEGLTGLADPVEPGVVPDTASGTLALFGQSPLSMRRGPVEALGAGFDLEPGDIALRANFATFDKKRWVIDRRAGRIREDAPALAARLDKIQIPELEEAGVQVFVRPSTEHRLAIILRGPNLSSMIRGSDPGDGAAPCKALVPQAIEEGDRAAARTARYLELFEAAARTALGRSGINRRRKKQGLPKANGILTRGAGRVHRLDALGRGALPEDLACISGDATIQGIASWLGAELLEPEGMTANLDTDLGAKLAAAGEALETKDLVFVHIKGADIAAHDRRPDLKVAFLERLDSELGAFLEATDRPLRIAIAADHATFSESGQHGADPVPVLVWGRGVGSDPVAEFHERAVAPGRLGRFPLQILMSRLYPPR